MRLKDTYLDAHTYSYITKKIPGKIRGADSIFIQGKTEVL